MTDTGFTFVVITILTVMFWTWVAQTVMGDSRQKCETIASVETCAWELR